MNLPHRRPARALLILPASIAQVILFGLSVVSTGGLGLVLWAGGQARFDTLSQQPLRRTFDWVRIEPAYAWALVFGALTIAVLGCIAFQTWRALAVVFCLAPLPFAYWACAGVVGAADQPAATLTGVSAYSTLAAVQVAIAVAWIVLLRLNPDGVAARAVNPPQAHLVEDVSARHPVALALYAAMPLIGALLGPLGPGSRSLSDALDTSLQWQWSIEAIVGGLTALAGAFLPTSQRFSGLFAERAADICLMFACLTYSGALLYRSGAGALGPSVIFVAIAVGFILRAAQITVRIRRVTHAADRLPPR